MKLIPLSQGFFAQVDDEDFEELSKYKWWISRVGDRIYANGAVPGQRKVAMHRYILGETRRSIDIDHKDGDTLNNQKSNLRQATRTLNNANSKIPKTNTSGYKGVTFDSKRGLWTASVGQQHLGRFECKLEAARHYNRAAKERWGDFARINKVEPLFPTIEKSDVSRRNTSGITGVWETPNGKWSASIIRLGVERKLGTFSNIEDASKAYADADQEFKQFGFLKKMTIDSVQSWKGDVPCCFFRFSGSKRLKRISNQQAADLHKKGLFDLTDMAKKWFIEKGLLPSE